MNISSLLNPRSVAVVGASEDPEKVGYAVLKNIMAGKPRAVYPVSLGVTSVLGLQAYASVSDIQAPVDLAVIAIRADFVPDVVRACGEKGIRACIVISAGFKEEDAEGKKREEELASVAREYDIALLGPNCLGILYTPEDWNASFAVGKPRTGSIAFLSQSGALGTALLDWATKEGVGFSTFVSLGNEAVLNERDFLAFVRDDPHTKAVLLYAEQITNGPAFLSALKEVTAKKPVVVLRAGRSIHGASAVLSHTGSLAPSDAVFTSALRQAGALPVDSLRDFFSLAKLFALNIFQNPPTSLLILTNGGGPSVHTADCIDLSPSLTLAELSEETQTTLHTVLPPMAGLHNPVDVLGDADEERYTKALTILTSLSHIEAIIAIITPQMMTHPKAIADVFVSFHTQKPIIPILMGGGAVAEGRTSLIQNGMVSFSCPTDAINALSILSHRKKEALPQKHTAPSTKRMLTYKETTVLLQAQGLTLEGILVQNRTDVAKACAHLKGPYALKYISPNVVHKSDVHAIETNLADITAVEIAWDTIDTAVKKIVPDAIPEGMLLQTVAKGTECIIGMKRDPVFGAVILFGLGGVFVEILKDVSMRIAPVTKEEALLQIQEIAGISLLLGARGKEPTNLSALAETIAKLSELSLAHPELQEIDCNPVFASAEGVKLVDVRLIS